MTRRPILLEATLGLTTLLGAMSLTGDASAFTPVRRFSSNPTPSAGTCAVNYPATTDSVAYQGGQVISNVEAVPVFWTSGIDPTVSAWAQGYLGSLVDSAYLDLLAQYSSAGQTGGTGQTIGRGTAKAAVTIMPTTATGTTVQDSAIGPELDAQITAGHLPKPTLDAKGYSNTLYVLFFPQSISVNYGGLSCASFCGYHGAYTGTSSFAYAVIPDMGTGSKCATGCSDSCTTGDTAVMAGTLSHELAEAVTDPANSPGWVNPNMNSQNSEIGDICASGGGSQTDTGPVPGTSILAQYEWSQRDKACLLANPGVDAGVPDAGSSSGSGSGGSSGSSSGSGSGGSSGSGSSSGGGSGSGSGSSGSSGGGTHGLDGGGSGGGDDAGSANFDATASTSGCSSGGGDARSSAAGLAGLAMLVLGVSRRRRKT